MSEIKLYLGDCLEILPTLEDNSVNTIFADPPYGIGMNYLTYDDTRENLKKLIKGFMPSSLRIAKNVIVTCGINNLLLYPEPTWILSWQYPGGNPKCSWGFNTWQPILVYGKDPKQVNRLGCFPDSVSIPSFAKRNDHPANKPIRFMRWVIERCSLPNNTILDPFMGSGTTGVACVQTGRNFIGIEIEPKYYKIAEKRIAEAQLQMRMEI